MGKRGKYKLVKENPTKFKPTHGCSNSPTYRSWQSMKARCKQPTMANYARYGGKGVSYCAEWENFTVFMSDMGLRPDGHTLDRIDSTKNYFKANCRWATPKQQAANRVYKLKRGRPRVVHSRPL